MSLKNRILSLCLFLGVFVLVEGLVIYSANQGILNEARTIEQRNIPILNKAHQMKLSVVQVQQWLTDISATRGLDGLNDGFDEAENNAQLFKTLLHELRELNPEREPVYKGLSVAFDRYYEAGKHMAQAYVDGGPAAGNLLMANFDEAAANLSNQVDPFLADAILKIGELIHEEEKNSKMVGTYILVGSTLVIALVAVVAFVVLNAISAIVKLPKVVARIADGDLSVPFETDRKDEIGEIILSLEDMRKQLLGMVTSLVSATGELSSSSDDLETISVTTNTNIQTQFSEINQVASSMSEMAATVQSVAVSISDTADAANQANIEASKGQQVVTETIHEINGLASHIENAAKAVNQLEKDTESITSVLDVIRGVAEQTNLLALNAAIEAARAGDQGRGFAVVADEVRTLASRTQEATEEINRMIEKLSSASRQAVEVMEESQLQAKNAVSKASETGGSLTTITSSVSNINDMCAQIASSAEQQSVVTDEISQNIERINYMSQENNDNLSQVSSTSDNMTSLSIKLATITDFFKT